MASLAYAVLFWVVLHLAVAGPLRPALADRLGEAGFRALFSILSAAGLVGLILAYRAAPYVPLWPAPPGARHAAMLLMLIAFVLLVFGASGSNPTSPAVARLAGRGELPVHGITRITRHPMLWAFALWAVAHLLNNGHLAALLLFGAILVTALNGMASIDRKRRRALGPLWDKFAARTSILPFAAILAGRNELRPGELSPARIAVGIALFAAALLLHGPLLGASPLAR